MEVWVNGSIDRALLVLKRKLMKEGVFRAIQRHAHYLKPSDRRKVKQDAARRRREKAERHYWDQQARSEKRQMLAEGRRS